MKKRSIALFVAAAMLTVTLAACAGNAVQPEPPPVEPPPETQPSALTCPADRADNSMPNPPADTHEAILRFSQVLFREVLAEGEDNPVISPLSAYYALAMVALGAGGETRVEFEAVLGRDPAVLAAELLHLSRALMDTAGSTKLSVAGSVWMAEEFTIAPVFAEAMTNYFNAPAYTRDFGASGTVEEINAWVAERTEGLIEKLIESISRDEIMLLINTLYFSAKWADAFNPMTEASRAFRPAGSASVEVPFLSTGVHSFSVAVTCNYEAIMLPYDDDRLGFLLVRPLEGMSVRDFAEGMDLGAIIAGLEMKEDVQVHMPKLDMEFEFLLNDLLKTMGLSLAFGDCADFSGLVEEDDPLRISTVLQKVRILVDEEGTEAAAATVVGIERMSIPLNQIELIFDTPYVYVILDLETGIPLFLGVLDNPV